MAKNIVFTTPPAEVEIELNVLELGIKNRVRLYIYLCMNAV